MRHKNAKSTLILKHQRQPKKPKPKRKSDYVPGFNYIFQDGYLSKIGLSETPKTRHYFLSREYAAKLQIRAIVFTMNMKLTEKTMHKIFKRWNVHRAPGFDGRTEWFEANPYRVLLMQVTLFLLCWLVNFAYLALAVLILMLFSSLVFR
ncbi:MULTISPECIES: GIY-YIG nuclease family protein [unclassified Microcoleus]|uniref:GIY-YIG nuclease family protein n=1 Tax=unclassified Microcoleus TaxID=2642155 RepID=UPI002FCFAE37